MPRQVHIPRRRTILGALTLALAVSAAPAQSPAAQEPSSPIQRTVLRTLTTLREAHSLPPDEARRGYPTRALLHDHLQAALDRSQRFHKGIALLMLDLDKFKQINDSYGHSVGDGVLRVTAGRLRANIRKTDSVARMGGDEFVVLLNELDHPGQAEHVAGKIVAALSEPVLMGKLLLPVSVSIGVCTISGSDELVEAEVLLKRVDAAMYRAKERGRHCFQVFTADMIVAPQPIEAAKV